jgi:HlyD family type I secretion membrane fusion protein
MAIKAHVIQPWYADIPRNPKLAKVAGTAIIVLTVMGFGVWGNTAPISGAVISSGIFVTSGQNKTIQHLEGGVIREIMVREGDIVQPGQLLVQLDDTAPRADMRRLLLRQIRLEAIIARLTTEAAGKPELVFPQPIQARTKDADIAEIVQAQRITFDARQSNLVNEIATHQRSIDALDEKIAGARQQLAAVHSQIKLIHQELTGKQELLARGFIRKPEVLLLQRNQANLQGELGRIGGEIGDARERIARTHEQIAGVRKTAVKAAVEQMHEIGADLNDVRERVRTAAGILDRSRITAPVKGTVVKLRYHTSGGVIEPGKNIMEIVSLLDELIIEARVRPQDIDKIKHSQTAIVRLTALNQRTTPMVNGTVIYISADALPDDKLRNMPNSTDYYVVRIRLDTQTSLALRNFEPTPGMPAEVYVQTAERTFFEYLMQPLKDSMSRAFRET